LSESIAISIVSAKITFVSKIRNFILNGQVGDWSKGDAQRTGLCAGWEIVFRLPGTAAWIYFFVEDEHKS